MGDDTYPRLNLNDIPKFPTIEEVKIPFELIYIILINLTLLLMVKRAFIALNVVEN